MIEITGPLIDNPSAQAPQGRLNFSIVFSRWLGANDWTHKKISTQVAANVVSDRSPDKQEFVSLLHEHQISNYRNAHFGRSLANNPSWRAFRAIFELNRVLFELNRVLFEINSNQFDIPTFWDQEFWSNKKAIVLENDTMPSLGDIYEFYCGMRSDFKLQGEQTVRASDYDQSEITQKLAKLIRSTFSTARLDIIDDWSIFANASKLSPSDSGDLLKFVTGKDEQASIHKILISLSKIAQGLNAVSGVPGQFSYNASRENPGLSSRG